LRGNRGKKREETKWDGSERKKREGKKDGQKEKGEEG